MHTSLDQLITAAHARQQAKIAAHEAEQVRQINAQITKWTADFQAMLLNELGADVVAALNARYVTCENALSSIRARFSYAGEVFELGYRQGSFELERRDNVRFSPELEPIEPTNDHTWFKRISFYDPDGSLITDVAQRVDVVLAAIAELAASPHVSAQDT
jgi:hypothetical protein